MSDCCTLTHTDGGRESESRVSGLQPSSATVQLLWRELTQRRPFRGEREKTLKMPEVKKKINNPQKNRQKERQSRRGEGAKTGKEYNHKRRPVRRSTDK